jgi:uncharacterized protein (DUF3084 family)
VPEIVQINQKAVTIDLQHDRMKRKEKKVLKTEKEKERLQKMVKEYEEIEQQRLEVVRNKANLLSKLIKNEDLDESMFANN